MIIGIFGLLFGFGLLALFFVFWVFLSGVILSTVGNCFQDPNSEHRYTIFFTSAINIAIASWGYLCYNVGHYKIGQQKNIVVSFTACNRKCYPFCMPSQDML